MDGTFHCATCRLSLNSDQQYQQHISGKQHLKKLKLRDMKQGTAANQEVPQGVPAQPEQRPSAAPGYGGFFLAAGDSGSQPSKPRTNGEQLGSGVPPQGGQTDMPSTGPVRPPPLPPHVRLQGTQPPQSMGVPPQPPQATLEGAPPKAAVQGSKSADPVAQAVMENAMGRLPTKRKMYSEECAVCSLMFNSESQLDAHLRGQKHAKKKRLAEEGGETVNVATHFCSFCNIHLNSPDQMEQHRAGAKHKKMVLAAKQAQVDVQKLPVPVEGFVGSVNTPTGQ